MIALATTEDTHLWFIAAYYMYNPKHGSQSLFDTPFCAWPSEVYQASSMQRNDGRTGYRCGVCVGVSETRCGLCVGVSETGCGKVQNTCFCF